MPRRSDTPTEVSSAHEQYNPEPSQTFSMKLADRGVDVDGLVADLGERHTERQRLCNAADLSSSAFPSSRPFQPCCITAPNMWRARLHADDVGRGVLIAAPHSAKSESFNVRPATTIGVSAIAAHCCRRHRTG